jgi:hypothetical protein
MAWTLNSIYGALFQRALSGAGPAGAQARVKKQSSNLRDSDLLKECQAFDALTRTSVKRLRHWMWKRESSSKKLLSIIRGKLAGGVSN